MSKLIRYFGYLAFVIAMLMSCSKSETPLGATGLKSIELSSTAINNIAGLNKDIVFTVTGDDGEDYTNESQLFIDGLLVNESRYAFDALGEYNVYAKLRNLESNYLRLLVIDINARELGLSEERLMKNQTLDLAIYDYEGNDLTHEATFYVNDNPISGNSFSSADAGSFEVYATYEIEGDILETDTKTFEVYVPKRYLVLEDYTGTWCGYCPGVLEAMDKVAAETEYVSIVALHKTSYSFPDPMHFDQLPILENAYDVTGYPSARLNRAEKWISPFPHAQAMVYPGQETNESIQIESRISDNQLYIDVDLIFAQATTGTEKIVVYVTEDGILSDQINYYNEDPESPYYQAGNPIPDFEHNNVLRESLTHVLGDAVGSLAAFEKGRKSYNLELSNDYNKNNLRVVVMLVNQDNEAINSRAADVGTKAEFN